MRRRVRRYRLRHKIHAIKIRPNNPLRFLKHKNVSVAIWQTIYFFVIRKATFRTQKHFNKQYTPKLKDQPFESERTHFDTGFNNGSIAMHRPTIIFSFLTKSQPLNKKQPTGTINQIKQSEKTIPATTQSKTFKKQTFKTNTTNHLINQS